jgi:hypothetical protein
LPLGSIFASLVSLSGEYFCRGGTKTLFCWGDVLPSHDELGKWLEDDFSGMQQLKRE